MLHLLYSDRSRRHGPSARIFCELRQGRGVLHAAARMVRCAAFRILFFLILELALLGDVPESSSRPHVWGAAAAKGLVFRAVREGSGKAGNANASFSIIKAASDKPAAPEDELFEEDEPVEIWGDLDDRRMLLSEPPCKCAISLRQAFNAALYRLVASGARNQLLLRYKLPLAYALELQGVCPVWPNLDDLQDDDLLKEVLRDRVLRVATVTRGPRAAPRNYFAESFLRDIVDEIDAHYADGKSGSVCSDRSPTSKCSDKRSKHPQIRIEYVRKSSTEVALQALDAGQAHMTDINMLLSSNPYNGITQDTRYIRSDQVMAHSAAVVVRNDTNVGSLPALRDVILNARNQERRTVVVDSPWTHQHIARILPPFTVYEMVPEGMPDAHDLDVLLHNEAIAAASMLPPVIRHSGLRYMFLGDTYPMGALFLLSYNGNLCCPTKSYSMHSRRKPEHEAPPTLTNPAGPRTPASPSALPSVLDGIRDKPGEDPALSRLRRELAKEQVQISSLPRSSGPYSQRWWGVGGPLMHTFMDAEDSSPVTPGPWSYEPMTPMGELAEGLDWLALHDPSFGDPSSPPKRRYTGTRGWHDAYNAALVQLLHAAVIDSIIEGLQEINVVPFLDCGGLVPGSKARSFPTLERTHPMDALMDVIQNGVVLVGVPYGTRGSDVNPEILLAQRVTYEVVAAIGAHYGVQLRALFVPFHNASHVLRALHKGLIHLAEPRLLFEYRNPDQPLEYRVRPTCSIGASRLWMFTLERHNVDSLEQLYQMLLAMPDIKDRRVAIVESNLEYLAISALPPGTSVMIMDVETAVEALVSNSVVAILGMETLTRCQIRIMLHEAVAEGAFARQGDPFWSGPEPGPGHQIMPPQTQFRGQQDAESNMMDSHMGQPEKHIGSIIEVDTGVTAVIQSFLAVSLRHQRRKAS